MKNCKPFFWADGKTFYQDVNRCQLLYINHEIDLVDLNAVKER
jgi:hypothetical protein